MFTEQLLRLLLEQYIGVVFETPVLQLSFMKAITNVWVEMASDIYPDEAAIAVALGEFADYANVVYPPQTDGDVWLADGLSFESEVLG